MRGFDCEVWISDTDNEGLAMMSMISLFYQDVEHDVDDKYRDVEHNVDDKSFLPGCRAWLLAGT